MINECDPAAGDDPFELRRFTSAQEGVYERALAELKRGQKRTHWIWYIFPQIDGLGYSATTKLYAIKCLEEAREYLSHPLLGARLLECTQAVFDFDGPSISEVVWFPDDLKLKSSMTLFAAVAGPDSVFARVLDKHFNAERDVRTLDLLKKLNGGMGQ